MTCSSIGIVFINGKNSEIFTSDILFHSLPIEKKNRKLRKASCGKSQPATEKNKTCAKISLQNKNFSDVILPLFMEIRGRINSPKY